MPMYNGIITYIFALGMISSRPRTMRGREDIVGVIISQCVLSVFSCVF